MKLTTDGRQLPAGRRALLKTRLNDPSRTHPGITAMPSNRGHATAQPWTRTPTLDWLQEKNETRQRPEQRQGQQQAGAFEKTNITVPTTLTFGCDAVKRTGHLRMDEDSQRSA